MSQLADALFTRTQQQVLALLYGKPDRSYYTREILGVTGMGVHTIKRELDRMVGAGILSSHKIGNQIHYQADPDCPLYSELLQIVRKTFGVADVLRSALEPLADRIEWGFVFGSMASGRVSSNSDIDLLLIGDIGFAEAVAVLHPVQETLGREINPKVYSREEWQHLLKKQDAFIKELLSKPRMDVIGQGNESGESGRNKFGNHRAR